MVFEKGGKGLALFSIITAIQTTTNANKVPILVRFPNLAIGAKAATSKQKRTNTDLISKEFEMPSRSHAK